MRDSADSDDYGVTRRGKKRGKFRYDEATYEKRNRHQPKLAAEDAHDDTDGEDLVAIESAAMDGDDRAA